jgi:hypothetical protein
MTTLTLAAARQARLSIEHEAYLSSAIRRYRDKATRALDLAREANGRGNRTLAAGLLDEAATFLAMAQGLTDQHTNTGEQR